MAGDSSTLTNMELLLEARDLLTELDRRLENYRDVDDDHNSDDVADEALVLAVRADRLLSNATRRVTQHLRYFSTLRGDVEAWNGGES